MKILVCGGRDYKFKNVVFFVLDEINRVGNEQITSIVHGNCPTGADRFVSQYAKENILVEYPISADWNKDGKSAGPIRNSLMLQTHEDIKIVVAFPGNRGTNDMIKKSIDKQKRVIKVADLNGNIKDIRMQILGP